VNGQPKPLGNVCEHDGVTKASVIHAELNCILKAQREGISIEGATLYVTHSPCEHCASLIIETGISRVVYAEEYRSPQGLLNLAVAGVETKRWNEPETKDLPSVRKATPFRAWMNRKTKDKIVQLVSDTRGKNCGN
jgi:dCMP deaminase